MISPLNAPYKGPGVGEVFARSALTNLIGARPILLVRFYNDVKYIGDRRVRRMARPLTTTLTQRARPGCLPSNEVVPVVAAFPLPGEKDRVSGHQVGKRGNLLARSPHGGGEGEIVSPEPLPKHLDLPQGRGVKEHHLTPDEAVIQQFFGMFRGDVR